MKQTNIFKTLSLLAVTILVGCAQPAKMEQMVVHPADLDVSTMSPLFSKAIAMDIVSGGKKTNPLWMSDVSSEDFGKALEMSLKGVGIFAIEKGRYALNAKLLSVMKPFMGFNMTVHSTVHYTLMDLETKTMVFDEDIKASYTATVGDAFSGVTRLKMANEGSIRENIHRFLLALSALSLK